MCELFGVSAAQKIELNSLLHTFFSHAEDHPHGWGMALFHKNVAYVEKQAVTANKSARLQSYLEQPVAADTMMAHIRLATKGNMEYDNCHPFVRKDDSGRTWTLAHNGTIFESAVLNPFFVCRILNTTNLWMGISGMHGRSGINSRVDSSEKA